MTSECSHLIVSAFDTMVTSIAKTITPKLIPNLYSHGTARHEVNTVYHFAKSVEQLSQPSAVYLEYPCDSGRVDAVIVTEHCLLLIEAKSSLSMKGLDSLEHQAIRLENPNDSLRLHLGNTLPVFRKMKWGITNPRPIWAVLLLETMGDDGLDVWRGLQETQVSRYPALSTYTFKEQQNPEYIEDKWHHLMAFKQFSDKI